MNTVDNVKNFAAMNVSTPIVVSVVVGLALFGGIVTIAKKSGVKTLKKGAAVAQGSK
ncbi:MAG: hypothetical protein AB9Q19_00455 [Candidatus Reddybacter sp.]